MRSSTAYETTPHTKESYWVRTLAITVAYFMSGYVGLQMPAVGSSVTLVWLPTGVAVACLYCFGYRYWPAISIGAVSVNLAVGTAWQTCFGIAVGNTAGPLITTYLLRRLQFNPRFERHRDIALLAITAHAGMLVAASCGTAVLVYSGLLKSDFIKAWLCWWAGDSMGVIAATPLLLVAAQREFDGIKIRLPEFAGWFLLTVVVTGGVFVLNDNVGEPAWALAFVPLPLIAWATLRFGAIGTSIGIILISVGAAYGTSIEAGPFYRQTATQQVLLLWVYMVVTATLGWLIASLHFAQMRAVNIQKVLEGGLRDASLGVLLTDAARKITYVNEGFTRLTGYDAKELLGRGCEVLQGEKTDPATVLRIRACLDRGGHFDGEILNYRKDGSTFWNGVLISPIFDPGGERVGFFGIQRNISANKEIEFALQRSEARLRTILDLEPECVAIISREGLILEMNPAGLAMVEADSLMQVRGTLWESLVDQGHRKMFNEMHSQVLAGENRNSVFPIMGLKGTTRWLESHAVPYRDDDDRVIGQLAVTRDITERKRAAEDLKASEVRYRELFEDNPHAMWVYELDTLRFLAVNNAAVEHYGFSREEFLAMTIKDIRPLDDVPLLLENVSNVTSGLDKAGVWRHRTKAGNVIQVEITSHLTEFDGHRAELVLANDVTDRRRLEEQIHVTQQRFQAIVERSHDLILILDRAGVIKFANPASRDVLGYEPSELVGRHLLNYMFPEDYDSKLREMNSVDDDLRGEFRAEVRVQHKSGEWRILDAVGGNLLDVPALAGLVFNCRDITERKEREVRINDERTLFEMLTTGSSLDQVLNQIAMSCESLAPGMKCSILLLDNNEALRSAAAPSLPKQYCDAIDGVRIGPKVGSCGTAAFTRRRVITSCIESDPLWEDFRDLALSNGLKACWSVPMVSAQGRVFGTLAMYYSEPREPSASELVTIERAASFCVLAIERHELLGSLRDSKIRMETLVSNLPGMAYRCQNDAAWTMTYVSSGCELVTGYQSDDLVHNGRVRYADLIHPDDRDWLNAKCQASLAARVPCSNTYRIIDSAGQVRWVLERASGVYADDGTLRCIDGFIQDITEARRIEEQVRGSLREKEAMLKEIHHRVKNNLQIVTSLLNLQVGIVQDPAVLNALRESQNRIRSMALVHETLYLSTNLGQIDLSQYLDSLCRHLFRSYGTDSSRIRLVLNVAKTSLDLERAIPFGLIINELISNSLKYAFPDGRMGQVQVDFLSKVGGDCTLVVSDDGIGLPESLDFAQIDSLGLRLVQDLIQQLSGTSQLVRGPGTTFRITFPSSSI